MAKGKRLKIVQAGRLVYGVIYSQAHPRDPEHVRAAKNQCSSEARKRMNFKKAWQKLELLLSANFNHRDLVITLTYDDANLPADRMAAVRLVRRFFSDLRKYRRARDVDLKYVYTTEDKHGNARLHHHIVINGTGTDIEVIRSLWTHGTSIEVERVDTWGYEGLAKYLTKEARDAGALPGARAWTPSLGLSKPEVAVSAWVEDNMTLTAPPGAVILDSDSKQNEFGSFAYIKYMLPNQSSSERRSRPPRTKKKKDLYFSDLKPCISSEWA